MESQLNGNQLKASGQQQRWRVDLKAFLEPYLVGHYGGYWDITPDRQDWIGLIEVTTAGSGYTVPPTITINGDGIGATAEAVLSGGGIGSINITNKGSGYTTATVQIDADPGDIITTPAVATAMIAAGAQSLNGTLATQNGDPITFQSNLIKTSSASDLRYTRYNALAGEMQYRKDVVYETGRTYPQVPICFYPFGHWPPGGFNPTEKLLIPTISVNAPVGIYPSYTTVIFGARMLQEVTVAPELEPFFGQFGLYQAFPVPKEPGPLVVVNTVDTLTQKQKTRVFVNGKFVSEQLVGDPLPQNGFTEQDLDNFLEILTFPCWGMQKLFLVSTALADDDCIAISKAMQGSMEDRY